jgi:hypothetical protein
VSQGRGVVVGSAVHRRLRKERVECGNYYGQQRKAGGVGVGVSVVEEEATLDLRTTTKEGKI